MIFMLAFYTDEQRLAALSESERNELVERHTAFREEAAARTRVLDSRGMQPGNTAVTVRPSFQGPVTEPGTAPAGSESLGGYYLVECPDRETAEALARAYPMPARLGRIEVRPVMTDWDYVPSAETSVSPAAVWRRYADVAAWPQWRHGVAAAILDGPFAAGATGRLTPTGRDPVPLRIVDAVEQARFRSETDLAPGATLTEEHLLEALPDGGTRIVHRATVPRALLDAYGMDFAPTLYEGMRRSVSALVATLEADAPGGSR